MLKLLDQKGQAFDAFKLLIAAIVAGAILVILLAIINTIIPPGQEPFNVISDGIVSTKPSPGKGFVSQQSVRFQEDTFFTADSLSLDAQINKEKVCFCKTSTGQNPPCPGNYTFTDGDYFDVVDSCGNEDHALKAKREISGNVWVYHNPDDDRYYVGFKPG